MLLVPMVLTLSFVKTTRVHVLQPNAIRFTPVTAGSVYKPDRYSDVSTVRHRLLALKALLLDAIKLRIHPPTVHKGLCGMYPEQLLMEDYIVAHFKRTDHC